MFILLLSDEKVLGLNLENLEAGDSVVVVVVVVLNLKSLNLVLDLDGAAVVVGSLNLDLNLDLDLVLVLKSEACLLNCLELSELLTKLLEYKSSLSLNNSSFKFKDFPSA